MSKRDVLRPLVGETWAIKSTQCYDSLSEIPNAYGLSTSHIFAEGICANSNLQANINEQYWRVTMRNKWERSGIQSVGWSRETCPRAINRSASWRLA